MNKIIASLLAALALGASLAACSSSTTATTKSGTETFYSKVTGKAAIANSTVFALTFKGPVNTTGTQTLSGSGPKKGQSHTFPTKAGNLVVTVTKTPVNTQKLLSASTCRFEYGTVVTYAVNGAKSTGSFAGSTGKGVVTVLFTADLPKLSSGKCNESNNAQPLASGAAGTFSGIGPLTVKS